MPIITPIVQTINTYNPYIRATIGIGYAYSTGIGIDCSTSVINQCLYRKYFYYFAKV